jgi:hypothetical protein
VGRWSAAAVKVEHVYHRSHVEGGSDATAQCEAWIATLAGVPFGLFFLLTAIDRNTQGEYIDDARALDYVYAVQTFIAGFLMSAIATAALLSFVLVLVRSLFRS